MRTKIVAGNWKMNLDRQESVALVNSISAEIKNIHIDHNRVMVFPPYINIEAAQNSDHRDSRVEVGAQNMHQEEGGAFTGEISAKMLRGAGVKTVILGHSERREYFNETDALLKDKVNTALNNELEVVFCFGEKLEERQGETHFEVVGSQLKNALFQLNESQWKHIVLAYEPVWAIGTGKTATPGQAQDMHAFIRFLLEHKYGRSTSESIPILYGGSCKPENAAEIFSGKDVDGGLIGGASLKAEDFTAIIEALK